MRAPLEGWGDERSGERTAVAVANLKTDEKASVRKTAELDGGIVIEDGFNTVG